MLQLFQKHEGDVVPKQLYLIIKSIGPTDVIKAYNEFACKANKKAVIPGRMLCESMGILSKKY